jgi:hypothetical protein
VVGFRQVEVLEEDAGEKLVVMLARMDETLF